MAAAVLGRDCLYQELCQISGVDELAGLPALDLLLAGHILVETNDPRHPYNFDHDKFRDVVYTEAGHSRRRIYHHRALLALEQASLPPAELAYHAEEAGLADLAAIEGNLHLAMSAAVEALNGLHQQALAQANEPFRVYLSCFRALRVCQDERANDLLVAAYNLMQERAAKMPDAASRQAFFENVPSNRTLIREFEASKLLMVRS